MLKEQEIEKLINKIRDKYYEYSSKHNSNWFNTGAFEDRLQMAIRNRMNLEAFALAEITNFEKIKEKYTSKKNETSFSEKVDRIIDEQIAKIKHYPKISFHPAADIETTYLLGALRYFSSTYWPIFWAIISDNNGRNNLHNMENELNNLASDNGSKPPKLIEDYILLLSRPDAKEIEKEKFKNNYLKQCAFLMYDIVQFCENYINSTASELSHPIRFDKVYISGNTKKEIINQFSNSTGYGALLKIKEYCELILENFRLKAFRRG